MNENRSKTTAAICTARLCGNVSENRLFCFPDTRLSTVVDFPPIETGGAGRGRRCRRPRKNVKIIIVRSADRNYYPITADAASRVLPPTANTARCLGPSRAHVHRRRRKRDIRSTL